MLLSPGFTEIPSNVNRMSSSAKVPFGATNVLITVVSTIVVASVGASVTGYVGASVGIVVTTVVCATVGCVAGGSVLRTVKFGFPA